MTTRIRLRTNTTSTISSPDVEDLVPIYTPRSPQRVRPPPRIVPPKIISSPPPSPVLSASPPVPSPPAYRPATPPSSMAPMLKLSLLNKRRREAQLRQLILRVMLAGFGALAMIWIVQQRSARLAQQARMRVRQQIVQHLLTDDARVTGAVRENSTKSAKAVLKQIKPIHHIIGQKLPSDKGRQDGLVYLNPKAAHPIWQLTNEAQARWEDRADRPSGILEDAVREYRQRYGRAPPEGFDTW